MVSATTGARALLLARLARGLTQEELAERAHVSERTLRAWESGRATRPHERTLRTVADALGLTGDDRDRFVAAWRSDARPVAELFAGRVPAEALRREIAAQRSLVRERHVALVLVVGADRNWRSLTLRREFEVVDGTLDRFTWLTSYDPEVVDPSLVRLGALVNAESELELDVPESGGKGWVVSLGRALGPGERHHLEYSVDTSDAYLPGAAHSTDDDNLRFAVVAPLDSLTFEIRFPRDVVPSAMWTCRQADLDAPMSRGDAVHVSPFGVVHARVEPAPSGVHGVAWDWGQADGS